MTKYSTKPIFAFGQISCYAPAKGFQAFGWSVAGRTTVKIKGKGTLYSPSPGIWVGRFSLGADPNRPHKYLYTPRKTFYCNEEWEARKEFENYRRELEENGIPDKAASTVGGYADRWLELRKDTYGSPRTEERERLDVAHIKELFPNVKLSNLTPPVIKTAYAEARLKERFDKELFQINKRLRQILNAAVDDGQIAKNPALKVVISKPEPEPKDYLDPKRLSLFNLALLKQPWSGKTIGAMILLHTGIRPAEMYGASWKWLDKKLNRLFIGNQYSNDLELRKPKSKASRDWIVIDDTLMGYLDEWEKIQKAALEKLGKTQNGETPIASNDLGERFDPTNYGRWFRNFCADNGFGKYSVVTKTFERNGVEYQRGKGYTGLCPNMFRDIQATALVGYVKVDPRTLQSRMRHSDPTTSLKYYTHPVLENEYKAAEAFSAMLSSN